MIIIKKIKWLTVLLLTGVFFISCNQNNSTFPELSGPYLGQTPPGMAAEIFAPGIISVGYNEVCISFTKDAKEMFYSIAGEPQAVVLHLKEENGKWTKPEVASFSGKYSSEFLISPDGNKIIIGDGSPLNGEGPPKSEWGIWIAERENSTWSKAFPLIGPLNTDEYSVSAPCISETGNIYMCSLDFPGVKGGGTDILVSKPVNGKYESLEILSEAINSDDWELDPYIAPDESYIIFSSNRPGGFGKNDLYISFRNLNGTWTDAINMGDKVNSPDQEVHASVSLDGKYLFFCSSRFTRQRYSETPITYEEKIEILNGPYNGNENIYWVDAKVIEELRLEK